MRSKNAILEMEAGKECLTFPGEGGYKIEWSPGTLLLPLEQNHKTQANDWWDDNVAIGALIAIQLILIANMQFTYDTPFLQILVFLFGTRSFLKFLNLLHVHLLQNDAHMEFVVYKVLICLFDTVVFVSLLAMPMCIASKNATEYVMTTATLIFLSCVMGSVLAFIVYNGHEIKKHLLVADSALVKIGKEHARQ